MGSKERRRVPYYQPNQVSLAELIDYAGTHKRLLTKWLLGGIGAAGFILLIFNNLPDNVSAILLPATASPEPTPGYSWFAGNPETEGTIDAAGVTLTPEESAFFAHLPPHVRRLGEWMKYWQINFPTSVNDVKVWGTLATIVGCESENGVWYDASGDARVGLFGVPLSRVPEGFDVTTPSANAHWGMKLFTEVLVGTGGDLGQAFVIYANAPNPVEVLNASGIYVIDPNSTQFAEVVDYARQHSPGCSRGK